LCTYPSTITFQKYIAPEIKIYGNQILNKMKYVKSTFKINFPYIGMTVMFSELKDGRFTRTYHKNMMPNHDYISRMEYIYALVYYNGLSI
jgi:hypothetical protein